MLVRGPAALWNRLLVSADIDRHGACPVPGCFASLRRTETDRSPPEMKSRAGCVSVQISGLRSSADDPGGPAVGAGLKPARTGHAIHSLPLRFMRCVPSPGRTRAV